MGGHSGGRDLEASRGWMVGWDVVGLTSPPREAFEYMVHVLFEAESLISTETVRSSHCSDVG